MATPQKIRCTVEKILPHGESVYSLELTPDRVLPIFKPGQFLQLAIDPYDPSSFWPQSRAFSIASSPENRNSLSITYSVRGKFTARMENELKVGDIVWLKLPFGAFIVKEDKPIVLIAGGTGITAFTAFLNRISSAMSQQVTLVYGARNPNLLIFKNTVSECKRRKPDFEVCYFVESLDGENPAMFEGRIALNRIWLKINKTGNEQYYLSGPPQMLKSITNQLTEYGIASSSISIDAWE